MDEMNLKRRVLVPVISSILLIFLFVIFITNIVSKIHFSRHLNDEISHARTFIGLIFDKKEPPQKTEIMNFMDYLKRHNMHVIISEKDKIIFTTLDERMLKEIKDILTEKKEARINKNDYIILKDTIVLKGKTSDLSMLIDKTESYETLLINTINEAIAVSAILIILLTAIIFRINLDRPIRNLITDLRQDRALRKTGIREFDLLGKAVNTAIEKLSQRSERYQMLHRIAVELNTTGDVEKILQEILDDSRHILDAEYSALALYDDEGRFKKLFVSGTQSTVNRLPEGKGILEFMKYSLTPVRINDVKSHFAFSGRFPEGHPDITSFLGYPMYNREHKPIGALYFANKINGEFTREDEEILKAISSNIAITIERSTLIEKLERFKMIIENAHDAVVVTDRNGNIEYVNRTFEKITGYTLKEVIGKNPRILKSGLHDDMFYKKLWQTLLRGETWKGEFINKKKNGELYYTSANIFPLTLYGDNITHFVSIQRDITEEKKLYEHLLRAQKMEAIGTLASGIAHDFNNILTSVLGYAELLKDNLEEDSNLYRYADIIEKSAERGAQLARKILTITRKEHIEFRSINLNDVVHEVVELLKKSIPKEITIDVKLDPDIPFIKADPSQISQVILNLAINAKDAMPEGGRLLIATSKVGNENGAQGIPLSKGFVRLTVEDTGKGIPKEYQTKIFDPFFTTKEPGKGTGLGLFIVHTIVMNHGGYINLYSEPHMGTRFNIYFPTAEKEGPEKKEVSISSPVKGGTVLVIDDEESICDLYEDVLKPHGISVIKATDPREGIRLFRSNPNIDITVLDLIMPGMSGREVFQILKEIRPDAKIVLSSGYSAELYEDVEKMLSSGAKVFLQKPVSPKTILTTIIKILNEE